ncbi:hypothetical protein T03_11921 [Trichinella britovi]|uniref:Uncharacterized protein n=1 Tax=Trichinella britovi TaxID=45882 RepID=A0A0V1CCM6_TRIBR|nr:hypothetical protein T03_8811 [Trichinella britovi]KRY47008.1 hypothetical protein T03_11921 [Trichinella britovi]
MYMFLLPSESRHAGLEALHFGSSSWRHNIAHITNMERAIMEQCFLIIDNPPAVDKYDAFSRC